jgi:MHS family proline/betaine transporter-like MFS transporter
MTIDKTKTQNSLTREQKEAVGLLSIGTFLEYFDLMLYVHMAVLLNELFFPKYDPFTNSLLSAFAFCSTYLLRPFGALLFGYIGDNIGRKHTVIITTFLMAMSCLLMANLPTYAEIGITASWLVTLCRITQGMAAMGEAVGAELYLIESVQRPLRFPVSAVVVISATLGTTIALAVASIVTSYQFNWRGAFWIGAIVAFIGTFARTTLRETPDFADAKKRLLQVAQNSNLSSIDLQKSIIWSETVNYKTAVSLFLIQCMWPMAVYFIYFHCGSIMKNTFDFAPDQIMSQNFFVAMGQLASYVLLTFLSYKIHPLFILKVKLVIFTFIVLACPWIINNISTSFDLLLLQLSMIIFVPTDFPCASIFATYFPVLKRFTYTCFIYALSRALLSVITSFGLVYVVNYWGNVGVLVIMLPVVVGYGFGLLHFQKLEEGSGYYSSLQKKNFVVYNKIVA